MNEQEIKNESYLVARGVRLIAEVYRCDTDEDAMIRATTVLERCAEANVIPFVFQTRYGYATCGYAAQAWVLDLFRWVMSSDSTPPDQANRILGLLYGYGPEAIRLFDDRSGARKGGLEYPGVK